MNRMIATILVVSVLALTGVFAAAPVLAGSVAYAAEVTDKDLADQLAKIKKMVTELEAKLKAKKMMMDDKGKSMMMMTDIEKMLIELGAKAP